jgi:hypothetical protein
MLRSDIKNLNGVEVKELNHVQISKTCANLDNHMIVGPSIGLDEITEIQSKPQLNTDQVITSRRYINHALTKTVKNIISEEASQAVVVQDPR